MFEKTALNVRNERNQLLVWLAFLIMTGPLILPVLVILYVLAVKGGPMLSWEFLSGEPTQGMTAGGIFPALLGTIWLVAVALLASVPLGVAAAIYLSEYAPDNWGDFGGSDSAVIEHIRRFADPDLANDLDGIERIGAHHYDWALNEPANAS